MTDEPQIACAVGWCTEGEGAGLMTWWEWVNRPPWGNEPITLDVILDCGLLALIVAFLLLCC